MEKRNSETTPTALDLAQTFAAALINTPPLPTGADFARAAWPAIRQTLIHAAGQLDAADPGTPDLRELITGYIVTADYVIYKRGKNA